MEEDILLQIAAPLSQRINELVETDGQMDVGQEGTHVDVEELLSAFEADPKLSVALERIATTYGVPSDIEARSNQDPGEALLRKERSRLEDMDEREVDALLDGLRYG